MAPRLLHGAERRRVTQVRDAHATSAGTFSSNLQCLQGSDGSEEENDRDDDPPAELARLRDVRPPAAPGRGEGGLPRAHRGGGDILHGKIRTSLLILSSLI